MPISNPGPPSSTVISPNAPLRIQNATANRSEVKAGNSTWFSPLKTADCPGRQARFGPLLEHRARFLFWKRGLMLANGLLRPGGLARLLGSRHLQNRGRV